MTIFIRPSRCREEFIELMVSHSFTTQVRSFSHMLWTFQTLKLDEEFEPVMDHLWKIGFDYSDFEGKRKHSFKDWRKALQGYRRARERAHQY
jgi:ABC-type thiamine transport system substrate-binding protein